MPIDRDATLKRAEKLLRQGKLEAAIAEYVALTSAHPGDWSSLNALGDLYLRAAQPDRAVVQFARAGEQLTREGALAKAAAVYRKILKVNPADARAARTLEQLAAKQDAGRRQLRSTALPADDADARMVAAREAQDASDTRRACALLIEAADLYEAQGRPSDALAAVAEAAGVDPAQPEYRSRMLQMLVSHGELMQARSVARSGIELVVVADAFERAGRRGDAVDTLEEAVLADPHNVALRHRALRQLVAAGDLDRARHLARTAADLQVITEALHGDDRGRDAVDVIERAADDAPENAELRAPLVAACLASGDIERAREAARTSQDWMLLADAMRGQGRQEEAHAAMYEATQRDPHDAALHEAFVRACLDTGDVARARDEARTNKEIMDVADALDARGDRSAALGLRADALRRDPDDPELRRRLIRDYLRAGDRNRAHALLTLETAAGDPELIVQLARLEFGIGRVDEARRALGHLLALPGEHVPRIRFLTAELAARGRDEAAFACTEVAADAALGAGEADRALALVESFLTLVPHHIPALLKVIEVSVDRGLKDTMAATQEKLTDAYLRLGKAAEARLIAEDLVLHAPWERTSVERLLRALVLCNDPEPEQTIANMLCGDSVFTHEDL